MTPYGALLVTLLWANLGQTNDNTTTNSTSPAAGSEQTLVPQDLETPLSGLYLSFRPSFGGAIKDAPILANSTLANGVNVFPTLPDKKSPGECLNFTGGFDLGIGYDFTNHQSLDVGIELHGGMLVWSGCQKFRVRSLSTLYGALGPRVGFMLSERLSVAAFVAGGIHQTDNQVQQDIPSVRLGQGLLLLGGLGVEYFVHMRHISVGIDALVIAPTNPVRISLGLAPHIRYTF